MMGLLTSLSVLGMHWTQCS